MARVGVYPGSFNPLTMAHLTIAEAALTLHRLDAVELVLSHVALAKESDPSLAPIEERVALIEQVASEHAWLSVRVTDAQLVADIALGYDLVVLGADKYSQLHDVRFYSDDPVRRDAALASLPRLAVAPRPPHEVPADIELPVPTWVREVSATAVRAGRVEWHGAKWRHSPSDRDGA